MSISEFYGSRDKVKIGNLPSDYARDETVASLKGEGSQRTLEDLYEMLSNVLAKLDNISGSVYVAPLKLLNTKSITVPTEEAPLSSYDSTVSSAKAIILITDTSNAGNVYIRKSEGDLVPMPKGVSLTLQIDNADSISIVSDNGTEKLYLITMG